MISDIILIYKTYVRSVCVFVGVFFQVVRIFFSFPYLQIITKKVFTRKQEWRNCEKTRRERVSLSWLINKNKYSTAQKVINVVFQQ